MANLYFSYIFQFIFSLSLFYILGWFIIFVLKLKIDGLFTRLFFYELIGLCLVSLVSALYFTRGKTILLGMLAWGIIFLLYRKSLCTKVDIKAEKVNLSLGSIACVISAGIIIYTIFFNSIASVYDIPRVFGGDILFYSKLSSFIKRTGIETSVIDYLYAAEAGLSPYHYFEIWLNAGLSAIFKNVEFLNFVLVVSPCGCFVTFIGICAIAEQLYKVNTLNIILTLFLLFFTGVYFKIYSKIYLLRESAVFAGNIFCYPKLSFIYIFLIASLISFIKKQPLLSVAFIALLPISSIATAPGVLLGLILIAIWMIIFKRSDFKRNIFVLFAAISTLLFILLFYGIFSISNMHSETLKSSFNRILQGSYGVSFLYIKTFINICAKTAIQVIILYSPFIFIITIWRKTIKPVFRKLIPVSLVFFSTALLSWAFFNSMLDSVQLFSNLQVSIFNVIFSILFIGLLESKSVVKKQLWISLIIVILAFNSYSLLKKMRSIDFKGKQDYDINFLHKIKREINNLNPIGCYIKNRGDYGNVFSKNPTLAALGDYLYLFSSNCDTISLSVFDTPLNNDSRYRKREEELISCSTFYRFVQREKINGRFLDMDEYKVKFLKENRIDFLITSKNTALPEIIEALIKKKITDPISGETFNIILR